MEKKVVRLHNCHSKALLRFAYSFLKNTHDAEDAVQDTFLKFMIANIDCFNENHERNLLFRIARQICCNKLNRTMKLDMLLPKLTLIYAHTDLKNIEDVCVITSIVNDLPIKYREVIHLTYYEERTPKEIASILNIPISTVYDRLKRAKKLLQKYRIYFE